MKRTSLAAISTVVMPKVLLVKCDLAFLFGTRHGVEDFCTATVKLWAAGMFAKILISGGCTADSIESEAQVISARLQELGMPKSVMILETAAKNTGENVIFGLKRLAEETSVASIRSVLIIGKICSSRRYLMTLERHWPGLLQSFFGVNYFGVAAEDWYEHDEFRTRVMDEFMKIPRYLQQGFVAQASGLPVYPDLSQCLTLADSANTEIARFLAGRRA